MGPPGKGARGRPKQRSMDAVKEDMKEIGIRTEGMTDRVKWKKLNRCGDLLWEKQKGEDFARIIQYSDIWI